MQKIAGIVWCAMTKKIVKLIRPLCCKSLFFIEFQLFVQDDRKDGQ